MDGRTDGTSEAMVEVSEPTRGCDQIKLVSLIPGRDFAAVPSARLGSAPSQSSLSRASARGNSAGAPRGIPPKKVDEGREGT